MRSPYADKPPRSFWRSGVAARDIAAAEDLFRPKFPITRDQRIATAGSCFAQHISRHLRARGYRVLDMEPAPRGLTGAAAQAFGFDLYSARYGNIYAVRHLRQLLAEAFGEHAPVDAVWTREGRFFDALRPSVEPRGLGSAEAVRRSRAAHLGRVRRLFAEADLLVFTLGLTEAWRHLADGTVYPTASGTIAESPDPDAIAFVNFGFQDILDDLLAVRLRLKALNPGMRLLLTVSPVPLTATATDDHVLVATTYSKSVLRAVAGELAARFDDVDYFPSYEIIATPPSAGRFYEPNLRSVRAEGVETVMGVFWRAYEPGAAAPPAPAPAGAPAAASDAADAEEGAEVVCEDALLEAFS